MEETKDRSLSGTLKELIIPSSFIKMTREFERDYGRLGCLAYLPVVFAEVARVYVYYDLLIKPVCNFFK